jgi:hypothetical protein
VILSAYCACVERPLDPQGAQLRYARLYLGTQEGSARFLADRFRFQAILEILFVGSSGASAPINLGLRRLLTIRRDIFSGSREIETVPGLLERNAQLQSVVDTSSC